VLEHVDVPYSDAWWLKRLLNKMNKPEMRRTGKRLSHRDYLDLLWSYRTGEPPLPSNKAVSGSTAEAEFLRKARTNYGGLAVNALLERTKVAGVWTELDGDEDGDDFIRRLLEANGPFLSDALNFTYTFGHGWLFAGKPDSDGLPLLTAEDSRNVVAATNPARPREIRALLKVYRDEDEGLDVAHVYRPAGVDPVDNEEYGDRIRVAVRKSRTVLGTRFTASSWEWDDNRSGELPVQGYGVPAVQLVNDLGLGEFEVCIDLLNRIMDGTVDRRSIAKFQAYRQRALRDTGDESAEDLKYENEEGDSIDDLDDVFEADPGAMWKLPRGTEIWESKETDLSPVLLSVRDDMKEFAAVTRTPLHMFTPDAISGSADGASLAREGLLFKAEDRTGRFTPDLRRFFAMANAFGNRNARDIDVRWAPFERYSLSQRAEAARAAKETDVPPEAIYTDFWQASPETAKRWKKQRGAELIFQRPGRPPEPPRNE